MTTAVNPTIASLETWRCQRHEALFDSARMGRSPMNWDVVVLRLNTDSGITGHATALAARSSIVTQAFLHEVILRDLRLGESSVDLRVSRHGDDVALEVLRTRGQIQVSIVLAR